MNDHDQWELYGMFAAVVEDHMLAESMAIEAEGEGMDEQFNTGLEQVYVWMFAQTLSVRREAGMAHRRLVCYVHTGNAHYLH